MSSEVRRIHIIGGPGSGKTTLARLLAQEIGAPCYDLDAVGYEGGAGARRPLDVKLREVRAIAEGPSWVTEGAFLWWIDDLLRAADVIVWLDLPFRIAIWRIPLRHLKAELRGTNKHPGWGNMWRLLGNVKHYHSSTTAVQPRVRDDDVAISRRATESALEPYMQKVIHCRRQRDVQRLRG
jgi:adenylate kinase family enzyme